MPKDVVIAKKQDEVTQIAEEIRTAATVVVVDYLGLTVSEVTDLRKQLRDNNAQMKVVKNTILRRAAAEAEAEGLLESFVGPTAIVFSTEDAVAPAKIVSKFAEKADELTIKGGMIKGKVATVDQVNELAKLPDRDGLLSMLLSVLQAPVRNVAYAVKAVAEKDETDDVA